MRHSKKETIWGHIEKHDPTSAELTMPLLEKQYSRWAIALITAPEWKKEEYHAQMMAWWHDENNDSLQAFPCEWCNPLSRA